MKKIIEDSIWHVGDVDCGLYIDEDGNVFSTCQCSKHKGTHHAVFLDDLETLELYVKLKEIYGGSI